MKKITKKTFETGIEMVVVSGNVKLSTMSNVKDYIGETEIEAYPISGGLDVECNSKTVILTPGTILITHACKNYQGSSRAIFSIKGSPDLYQTWWLDFAGLTRINPTSTTINV